VVVLFSPRILARELRQLDSELSTTLRETVTSRVSSRILFMIQAEEPHLQRFASEIRTDTSRDKSISSQSKECTQANTSTAVPRLNSPLEILSQSMPCQKEPLCPTARVSSVTEDHLPDHPVPLLSSLVTPMMERRPELDFHPVPERPSSVAAEPWSVSALVVRELRSHC